MYFSIQWMDFRFSRTLYANSRDMCGVFLRVKLSLIFFLHSGFSLSLFGFGAFEDFPHSTEWLWQQKQKYKIAWKLFRGKISIKFFFEHRDGSSWSWIWIDFPDGSFLQHLLDSLLPVRKDNKPQTKSLDKRYLRRKNHGQKKPTGWAERTLRY